MSEEKIETPKNTPPPWPFQTWRAWKEAKVEKERQRKKEPFYPDFDNDVFAGVL